MSMTGFEPVLSSLGNVRSVTLCRNQIIGTHFLYKWKYHCIVDLLFCRFGFNQTSKSVQKF